MDSLLPEERLSEISTSLSELFAFERGYRFIRSRWFDGWRDRAVQEASLGFWGNISLLLSTVHESGRRTWAAHRFLKRVIKAGDTYRRMANERVSTRVLQDYSSFFDEVESNPLTARQREAVASDEDSTLVIAGAGTGKTSTVLAKIGLLIKSGQCSEKEVLAISFTRKSADELADRVHQKLGLDLDISTFHKLGLDVIANATGGKPRLAPFVESPDEKIKHIDRIINSLSGTEDFKRLLVDFVAYFQYPPKTSWDFQDLAEYRAWLSSNKVRSLDGEPKKSYEECLIANWLILNGIAFEYEKPYEHNTKSVKHRQYCPDFHICEPNLYIEHFGVDKNGIPAPYIDAEKYKEGMEWKRETHRANKTILIESYSWERRNGTLLSGLESKLLAHGCALKPADVNDVLKRLNEKGLFKGFSEVISTFLTLYKGNGSRLATELSDCPPDDFDRNKAFLEIFQCVFAEYERINFDKDQIDFEDMISVAAKLVKSGRYRSPYKYILVDEFQDISPGRAELVNSLLHSMSNSALFAVGDDWQSIYRFAGSDIGGMTKFEQLFGPTNRVSLDTTFRFDNYAVATSSRFVLKNKAQISKRLNSIKTGAAPSVFLYKRDKEEAALEWCLDRITEETEGRATVLILERYRFYLPDDDVLDALSSRYRNLTIQAMTVHKSKGLEGDYVIVGLSGGSWGFPATKSDDTVLNMVLTQNDAFPYGEERRLFYVAITRARRKTFLVCETGGNFSVFAAELDSEKSEYGITVFGADSAASKCTKCESGTMVLRDGANGKFYGCSNFPLCDNLQPTCPQCQEGLFVRDELGQWQCNKCSHQLRSCPWCQTGLLQQKTGPYGAFIGCSNYREPEIECRYKEKGNLI